MLRAWAGLGLVTTAAVRSQRGSRQCSPCVHQYANYDDCCNLMHEKLPGPSQLEHYYVSEIIRHQHVMLQPAAMLRHNVLSTVPALPNESPSCLFAAVGYVAAHQEPSLRDACFTVGHAMYVMPNVRPMGPRIIRDPQCPGRTPLPPIELQTSLSCIKGQFIAAKEMKGRQCPAQLPSVCNYFTAAK